MARRGKGSRAAQVCNPIFTRWKGTVAMRFQAGIVGDCMDAGNSVFR